MKTIAIFSDVHGNSTALRAVLADIARRNADQTYCLGDLVGYGPDPNGVIDLVREAGIVSIMGNYDDGVGFARGDCGCFYRDEETKRLGALSYDFTARTVTSDRKGYLRGLPTELRVELAATKLHFVHGSPRKINEYLLPNRDARTFQRIAVTEDADVLIFGHTHTPWHQTYSGVLFVNVGSTGKPKDGDPRACYSLLQVGEGRAVVVGDVRVDYDVEEVAARIVELSLPPEFAAALREAR